MNRLAAVFLSFILAISLGSAFAAGQKVRDEFETDGWWAERAELLLRAGYVTEHSMLSSPNAILASTTWNASPTNGNWVTSGSEHNWGGVGTFPGATSGTANVDIATFLTSTSTTITINSGSLNVGSMQFGNSGTTPSNFTIGTNSNPLFLTSGGEIAILGLPNGASNVTETLTAPVVLEGSYTFRNSSSISSNSLVIRGTVTGAAGTAVVLTLAGSNGGTNGGIISGAINDGASSGIVSLTKSTGATWTLSGLNNYSGGTTISAGLLKLSGSGTLGATSGALTVSFGTLDLGGTTQTVGAFNGTLSTITSSTGMSSLTIGNGGGIGSYAGSISNTGLIAVAKTGNGIQTFTGTNSYSGSTTVSGGTLKLANATGIALSGTSGISVKNNGTLLMGGNNQIKQGIRPPISLGTTGDADTQAKFDAGGFSQGTGGNLTPNSGIIGLGALTLSSNSIIDLTGTSVLHFSDSNGNTWTGTLSIYDWNGTPLTGGSAEQILFGGTVNGLSLVQLTQISFYSDAGTALLSNTAVILADGEIVPGPMSPVPEPSTWIAGALAVGVVGWSVLKKRKTETRKS